MAGKEDFEASKRARLFSRIATGNWDGVIVTHASFEKIPMSFESRTRFIESQIREVELAIRQDRGAQRGTRLVKELERIKKKLKARLETLSASHRKDNTLTFEELGIDRLFVDEAHKFKNLFYVTKMNRVAGLPQTASERAFDLFLKVQFIQERNQGGGVVFATGTPISNTMAEMFTMQRYLQMHTLRRNQMQHFDSWAATFGEAVSSMELSPDGKRLPAPDPFRALRQRARTHGPVPAGGRRAHGRDAQIACAQAGGRPARDDQRPGQPRVEALRREPGGSHRRHQERAGRSARGQHAQDHERGAQGGARPAAHGAARGRQPGFQGQPGGGQRASHLGKDRADQGHADGFLRPVHAVGGQGRTIQRVRRRAREARRTGHSRWTKSLSSRTTTTMRPRTRSSRRCAKAKYGCFWAARPKMGEGTNVQRKLAALHHLDAPWRPADIEQREGRIVRQGNQNEFVSIFRYVTEGSFDAYMWQTLENKCRFIAQVMNGDADRAPGGGRGRRRADLRGGQGHRVGQPTGDREGGSGCRGRAAHAAQEAAPRQPVPGAFPHQEPGRGASSTANG